MTRLGDCLLLLRGELASGRWKIGDKLPPEEHFMEQFRVSRTLLREAMKLLIADGIIVRHHGSGTYFQSFPRRRVELYVRLENIISLGSNWFRWQIDYFKRQCHLKGYDLEVLVSYGETPNQKAASFQRHLSCPLSPDVVGSIVLFHNPDLESRLLSRGGSFVTITTVYGAEFQDSAVVLDYEKMGEMMGQEVASFQPKSPCLVWIADNPENVGATLHSEMQRLYTTVLPDRSRHLVIADYENVERDFGRWLDQHGEECDLLIFADDEVAKMALGVIARTGREYPKLNCLTHGNLGLFSLPEPKIGRIRVVGFSLADVASKAWEMVNSGTRGQVVRIAPECAGE